MLNSCDFLTYKAEGDQPVNDVVHLLYSSHSPLNFIYKLEAPIKKFQFGFHLDLEGHHTLISHSLVSALTSFLFNVFSYIPFSYILVFTTFCSLHFALISVSPLPLSLPPMFSRIPSSMHASLRSHTLFCIPLFCTLNLSCLPYQLFAASGSLSS